MTIIHFDLIFEQKINNEILKTVGGFSEYLDKPRWWEACPNTQIFLTPPSKLSTKKTQAKSTPPLQVEYGVLVHAPLPELLIEKIIFDQSINQSKNQ